MTDQKQGPLFLKRGVQVDGLFPGVAVTRHFTLVKNPFAFLYLRIYSNEL